MKIYAIADLHLSFNENIDKPMEVFGPGWDNYVPRLAAKWQELVDEDDVVIIPGDVSWALKLDEALDDLEWIHARSGRKIILKGNHDLWWSKIQYLNKLYDDMTFLQNACYYVEDCGLAICGTRGWVLPDTDGFDEHDAKVLRRELLRLQASLEDAKAKGAKEIIVALHFPPADASNHDTDFTKLMKAYGVKKCVYGHLHGAMAFNKAIRGLHDGIEYKLVSLDYLRAVPTLLWEEPSSAAE